MYMSSRTEHDTDKTYANRPSRRVTEDYVEAHGCNTLAAGFPHTLATCTCILTLSIVAIDEQLTCQVSTEGVYTLYM